MIRENTIKPLSLRLYTSIWLMMGLLLLLLILTSQPLIDWIRVDRNLMLTLNGDQGAWVDQFWYAFSKFGSWGLVFPVLAVTLWYSCQGTWRQRLLYLLLVVALFCLLDQLSSSVIKPLVARPRPSHDPAICGLLHYVNGYHGGHYGFVSGHATNIAGLCTWLCLTYRDRLSRTVFVLFAASMCYSRIYLGVHYPGDIIGGILLGSTIAYFVFRQANRYFVIRNDIHPYVLLWSIGVTVFGLLAYSAVKAFTLL